MRAFFIAIPILFVVVVIGLLVFILTFDVNQYKDPLVEKIEEVIAKDVKMGNISLNLFPGLTLRIDELSIKDSDKTWVDAILDAESVNIGIKLLPLMKKDIQVQYLNVRELNMNIARDFPSAVFKDIELKGAMRGDNIVLHRLSGMVAGGYFSAKGTLKELSSNQYSVFNITLKDINIAELLPGISPDTPQLEGRLSLNMQCSAKGLDVQKVLDTLSANGTARLDKAALGNINILNVALGNLNSILPGLVSRLKERLPQQYSKVLKQDFTAFKPIEVVFDIEKGKISFQKTKVESDVFYMIGAGHVSFKGDLEINATLFILQDLSRVLIDEVNELKYLQNKEGMITIPVYIDGGIFNISVRPDIDYLMERLALATGEELLRGIFRKEKSSSGEPEEAGRNKEPQEDVEPEKIIMKTIFDIISGPENKQGGDR
jgi:hypothetical protein